MATTTMNIARSPSTLKDSLTCSPYKCSTTPTGNNNSPSLMYHCIGDEEVLIASGVEASVCYGSVEPIARPINLPPGYISISSVSHRRHSTDSEELMASCKYESDFWPPSLNVFSKRRRKISYAEEALPSEDDSEESKEMSSPLRISGLISSLPSISFPKLPERPWFCNTCRKPKDECNCLCVIS